jgi:hypothetical protein
VADLSLDSTWVKGPSSLVLRILVLVESTDYYEVRSTVWTKTTAFFFMQLGVAARYEGEGQRLELKCVWLFPGNSKGIRGVRRRCRGTRQSLSHPPIHHKNASQPLTPLRSVYYYVCQVLHRPRRWPQYSVLYASSSLLLQVQANVHS